jgi:hypothetical protein
MVLIAGYGGFDFGIPYSVIGDLAGECKRSSDLGRQLCERDAVIHALLAC